MRADAKHLLGDDITALTDPDPTKRQHAALRLGKSRDTLAVDALIKAFRDDDPTVRRRVLQALDKIGDKRALAVFEEGLYDPVPYVRTAAVIALHDLGELRSIVPLLDALRKSDENDHTRLDILDVIAYTRRSEAVDTLIDLALDSSIDEGVRAVAAETAGKIGDDRVVQPLIGLLRDANPNVVLGAIGGLVARGDRSAVLALIAQLTNDTWVIRSRAAEALGTLGDERALPALELLAQTDTAGEDAMSIRTDAREAAVTAIKRIKGDDRGQDQAKL